MLLEIGERVRLNLLIRATYFIGLGKVIDYPFKYVIDLFKGEPSNQPKGIDTNKCFSSIDSMLCYCQTYMGLV